MYRHKRYVAAVSNTIVLSSVRWSFGFQLRDGVPPRTRIRHSQGEYNKLLDSRVENDTSS